MKVRTLLQTSLVAVLVAAAGLVSAQDNSTCLNLSADDCAYLTTAASNGLAALGSSFQQDFTIDAVVSGIPDSADAEFHLVGSGPVVASTNADVPVNFGATLDVNFTDGTTKNSGTLEVRLVDGVVYIQDPTDDMKWKGVSVKDAMASAESSGQVPNPSNLDLSSLGLDEADMTALMDLPKAEGFLDLSRDGETFTFTADVGALLKSTEWAKLTSNLAPKLQQNPDTAQFAMILPALSMLLTDGKVTVVQVVDPAVNAVTEMSVNIDGSLNAGAMSGDSSAAPITLSVKFNVKVSNIGGDLTVEAPADAEMQEIPAATSSK